MHGRVIITASRRSRAEACSCSLRAFVAAKVCVWVPAGVREGRPGWVTARLNSVLSARAESRAAMLAHHRILTSQGSRRRLKRMRTTLTIDDDVLAVAKGIAERRAMTVGQVISLLARRALQPSRSPDLKHGVPLLPVAARRPKPVALDLVNELRDGDDLR